jgi:hypothetical protein
MPDERPTGRAPVRRPGRGRARVGRAVGKAPLPENAVTGVIRRDAPGAPPPVFVDPTGARRRRVRRVTYTAGVLLVLVVIVVWLSQLGGPARPPAREPCPSAVSGVTCAR